MARQQTKKMVCWLCFRHPRSFNKDGFPNIGTKPIAEIKPLELLYVLRRIEGRGATEKAKKFTGKTTINQNDSHV